MKLLKSLLGVFLMASLLAFGCEKQEPNLPSTGIEKGGGGSSCEDACPNTIVVTLTNQYPNEGWNCIFGYINYTSTSGPAFANLNSGGLSFAITLTDVCPGSDLEICIDKYDGAGSCNSGCINAIVTVAATGYPANYFKVCDQRTEGEELCYYLGYVELDTLVAPNACKFYPNTNWGLDQTPCEECDD